MLRIRQPKLGPRTLKTEWRHTGEADKEFCNVENIGGEAGRVVVHLVLFPGLVRHNVKEDIDGAILIVRRRPISMVVYQRAIGDAERTRISYKIGTRSTMDWEPETPRTAVSPSLLVIP